MRLSGFVSILAAAAASLLVACAMRPAYERSAPAAPPPPVAIVVPAPAAEPAAMPAATPAPMPATATAVATTPAAPAAPAAAPPPAPPAPFAQAVGRAGGKLFGAGAASLGSTPRVLVIDPLIDAATGQQTGSSVQMGRQLAEIVQSQYPMWTVHPLTRSELTSPPLLLIGTLTAINTKKAAAETADAFGICLRLVDLRTGKVVARNADRATVDSVDAEPTPYFRDSPTWHKDKTSSAYIKSCQGTAVGDAVDPVYLLRLPAAAVLNEALMAYSDNRLPDAYRLYREAAIVAEPDDLRVLNGQYLTSWRSGRRAEAAQVFDKIVQVGFNANSLPLKLLFAPGGTSLLASGDLRAQYAMWLQAVGSRSSMGESCLRVVGHTSHTGSAALNDALSERRAEFVQQRLEAGAPALGRRVAVKGVGWRENLIGLGTDDLRDALDRRVEFRVVSCPVS